MDPNTAVTAVMVGLFVAAYALRGRARWRDRKRDEREAARRAASPPDDRSLY